MRKKSQVAMESLMVYGIAILIVMLAIGALIYFGVLDLGSYLPDKCSLPGQLKCENYRLSSTLGSPAGQATFEFRNSVGKNIQVNSIEITGVDDFVGLITCSLTGQTVAVANGALSAPMSVPCAPLVTFANKKIKAKFTVTYTAVGSALGQPIVGEIQAKVN